MRSNIQSEPLRIQMVKVWDRFTRWPIYVRDTTLCHYVHDEIKYFHYALFLRHKIPASLEASMENKEARLEVCEVLLQVGSEIAVLDMGVKFSYQIPSFSVLIVDLRRVKLQLISEDGSVVLRDGFIRADPSLEVKPTPF